MVRIALSRLITISLAQSGSVNAEEVRLSVDGKTNYQIVAPAGMTPRPLGKDTVEDFARGNTPEGRKDEAMTAYRAVLADDSASTAQRKAAEERIKALGGERE